MKNILLLFIVLASLSASAQKEELPSMDETDTGAMIKASFLYNFAKLVDWPEEYKKGNFVISVMGGENLYREMVKKYNTKHIGSQQIEIRKLSKTLNISECHLLYVGAECVDLLPEITEKYRHLPILIVTDDEGALDDGAIINMVPVESEWMYELNVENASDRKLFIGSMLRSMAIRTQQGK